MKKFLMFSSSTLGRETDKSKKRNKNKFNFNEFEDLTSGGGPNADHPLTSRYPHGLFGGVNHNLMMRSKQQPPDLNMNNLISTNHTSHQTLKTLKRKKEMKKFMASNNLKSDEDYYFNKGRYQQEANEFDSRLEFSVGSRF